MANILFSKNGIQIPKGYKFQMCGVAINSGQTFKMGNMNVVFDNTPPIPDSLPGLYFPQPSNNPMDACRIGSIINGEDSAVLAYLKDEEDRYYEDIYLTQPLAGKNFCWFFFLHRGDRNGTSVTIDGDGYVVITVFYYTNEFYL